MSFPTINYKYNNIEEAPALTTVLELKFTSLEKFLKEGDPVSCDVEFQKIAPKQNGKIHRLEVNLRVDGVLFRADAVENTFEEAIDEVRNELDKEMRRNKSKKNTLARKAGQALKRMVRRKEN